jgi:regulator of cell morphogenesis and NO signaling
LLKDLDEVLAKPDTNLDFNSMSLTELAEYIVRVHHGYTREQMPQTLAYVERVALKHGDRFPYMRDVYVLFSQLMQEMNEHMLKEEKILFPRIKLLELDPASVKGSDFMQGPIDIMEEDHELAGTTMRTIRQLTNNYTPAETACTTHRLAIASLQAFEVDLHQHVHLENNILFPKAIAKVRDSQKVY